MNIDAVHKEILDFVQVERNGSLNPQEIDRAFNKASQEVFFRLIGGEIGLAADGKPVVAYGRQPQAMQDLGVFRINRKISSSERLTGLPTLDSNPLPMLAGSGTFLVLPEESEHEGGGFVVVSGSTRKIDFITDAELAPRLGNTITKPTLEYPVLVRKRIDSISLAATETVSEPSSVVNALSSPLVLATVTPTVNSTVGSISFSGTLAKASSIGSLTVFIRVYQNGVLYSSSGAFLQFQSQSSSQEYAVTIPISNQIGSGDAITLVAEIIVGDSGPLFTFSNTRLAFKPSTSSLDVSGRRVYASYPENLSFEDGEVFFFKKPTEVVWAYTQSGESLVYDPANSVDPEWDDARLHNSVIPLACLNVALTLNSPDLIQKAQLKLQQ